LILFPSGKSLGSCPTTHLASKQAFRGVICVAGLASGARILFPTTKVWALDAQFFNNLGHLAASKSPVQARLFCFINDPESGCAPII